MNPKLEELACSYVLDELEPQARAAFEERLRRDPALAALVRDLEAVIDETVRALPRHESPGALLAGVESRLDRHPQLPRSPERSSAAGRHDPWRRLEALRWAALGGIAALLIASAGIWWVQRQAAVGIARQPIVIIAGLGPDRTALKEMPLRARAGGCDARFMQLASLAEQFWDRPDALPVQLSADERGRGYAVFDPATAQGFLAVQRVPSPGDGRRYHLWIVDVGSGAVRDAGVLPIEASRGLFFFSVSGLRPAEPGQWSFFITAEEDDSAPATVPRGPVVLGTKPI